MRIKQQQELLLNYINQANIKQKIIEHLKTPNVLQNIKEKLKKDLKIKQVSKLSYSSWKCMQNNIKIIPSIKNSTISSKTWKKKHSRTMSHSPPTYTDPHQERNGQKHERYQHVPSNQKKIYRTRKLR